MTIEERFQSAVERAAQSNFRVERRIERILHDDVPTFMEAPPYGEVSDPDIVVAGVPFEGRSAGRTALSSSEMPSSCAVLMKLSGASSSQPSR